MKTNKQLLSKSEQIQKMVALPSIVLEAEEADRFIDYIIDESVLKDNARIIKMEKQTKNIRALGIETRFLHPGATFGSSDYLKQLSTQKIPLVSKKIRGAVAIYDDDLEDNVEGDAFADHVMRMVAGKIANELDEAFWIGDTAGFGGFAADDIRSLWDGWRYRIRNSQSNTDPYWNAVSGRATLMTALNETVWTNGATKSLLDIVQPVAVPNGRIYICIGAGTTGGSEPTWPSDLGATVVDNGATWRCHGYDTTLHGNIVEQAAAVPYNWEFKYSNMLKKLPSKYKAQGLDKLRFFNSDQITQDYIDALASRSTILGDKALVGNAPMQFGKVKIASAPLMGTTMDATGVFGSGAYADCLLTHKDNLIVGIQRNIKIESQRVAADEATYWFYSMRADTAIENVNACVLMERITIG